MSTPLAPLLFEIKEIKKQNPKMLRIILTKDFTQIDFGYIAPWYYVKGGWIKISPETYLQIAKSENKYSLLEAKGIPIAPNRIDFQSTEDWQFFSLMFEAIPYNDCILNMIESDEPDENDFNYYGIELKLNEGVEIENKTY